MGQELEEELEEIREEAEDSLSRNEVAKLFKVSPRTVIRWTLEGILKRNGHNRYDRKSVEALKKRNKDGFPPPDDGAALDEVNLYEELTKGVGLANSHVERLFAMLEKPLSVVINGLTSMNEQLSKRVADHDASYLAMMQGYGDMLMKKDEREAIQAREAVKTAMLANAAEQVLPLVPVLLSQMLGGKGKDGPGLSSTARFIASLTPEQKAQFAMMGGAFEGEQKEAFEGMLRETGLAK